MREIKEMEIEGSPYNPKWPMLCPICKAGVVEFHGCTWCALNVDFACGSNYRLRDKIFTTVHDVDVREGRVKP